MPEPKAPPDIFNTHALQISRARAARRGPSFVVERSAQDAADRLCDINRRFEKALVIGSAEFAASLEKALPAHKLPSSIARCHLAQNHDGVDFSATDAAVTFDSQSFDVIISGLCLQSVNDLPGALVAVRQLLKPDGLMIAAMFGGGTLTELRRAFYAADEHIFKNMSAHIYPFADYSQAAALLQRTGYALPVVDADRFTVRYAALQRLLNDLRDIGESNCLTAREHRYLGKAYKQALHAHYNQTFSQNGKLKATFEILWLTGWAPHESQQKPLKPGSAKMRLADALGTKEAKA